MGETSDATEHRVDSAVEEMVGRLHDEVHELLGAHRAELLAGERFSDHPLPWEPSTPLDAGKQIARSAGYPGSPVAIRSASREASAMIVSAGLAEPWVGITLPSATNRLGTPQTRWSESTTLSSGEEPIRQPPTRWA